MQPAGRMLTVSSASAVDTIREDVRRRVGPLAWQNWFERNICWQLHENELVLKVSTPFLQRWMDRQFGDLLADSARAHLGPSATMQFAIDPSQPSGAEATAAPPAAAASAATWNAATMKSPPPPPVVAHAALARDDLPEPQGESPTPVRRRFADLSDFVSGPSNQMALAAIRRMCQQLGAAVNPLALYGPVGIGKTHLLEGVYRQVRRQAPATSVLYLTAEAFTNCFTEALREHTLPAFRQKFRTVSMLIVDDIDFLDGKKGVQEEFLHTFKQLQARNGQVVVSCDRHPRQFTRMSEDLVTRFLAGMVCRLDLPDVATREAIAQHKAVRMNADFAPDVLRYVAERFPRSVREIEGALHCLQTWQSMMQKRASLTAARQVLSDLERDCVRVVRLPDVERVVCQAFALDPADLRSSRRTKALAQPRMVAMYLARKHTPAAYSEIGQFFGGRNHSTVISAERKIGRSLGAEDSFRVAAQNVRVAELVRSLEQQLLVG